MFRRACRSAKTIEANNKGNARGGAVSRERLYASLSEDQLKCVATLKLVEHPPNAVDLTSFNHLNWLEPIKGIVGLIHPRADRIFLDDVLKSGNNSPQFCQVPDSIMSVLIRTIRVQDSPVPCTMREPFLVQLTEARTRYRRSG